ncbi:hypothetical protein DRO97_01980 [Archaeoglobales archaeon]|nr:MAG: hypothetical protein DRO97_01980 [Archaeoglobales archaeon]
MINIKIKNRAKKDDVKVPYTVKDKQELVNKIKILEFDIKRLELDLMKIGDPDVLNYAKKRLEDLKGQLEVVKTALAIVKVELEDDRDY